MLASSHRQPHESTHKSSQWLSNNRADTIRSRRLHDCVLMVKRFAVFEFDDQRRTLKSRGQPVKLSGQALDLLALLLERPGELVTRSEIERRLWPDRTVEFDHSVDVVVSRLRATLGEKGSDAACVETVPRRGYRLVVPVTAATEQRRQWRGARRALTYAAIAVLAAILTILIARTRYDRFIPPAPVARPSTR